MIHPDLDDQIDNWVRWSRARPGSGHCASVEHHYRPPKCWWPEGPRVAVDVLAALTVERAMRVVPAQHQRALILHYVYRSPSSYICRKLPLRKVAWEQFLHDARTMLRNILARQEKARIRGLTTRPQPTAETFAPTGAM